jgi:hypothetical protein
MSADRILIHISGPSGSGKTTLMNKLADKLNLSAGAIMIDLDSIDDKHALQLLDTHLYKTVLAQGDIERFSKKKDKLNQIWLRKFYAENRDSNIILFGISFGPIAADRKYTIKVNPKDIYKRVYIRTLHDIYNNQAAIHQIITNEHPEVAKTLCVHKFGIRQDFIGPYYTVPEDLKKFYAEEKSAGYMLKTWDQLYKILTTMFSVSAD